MTPTLIVTRPALQGEAFAKAVAAQWDGKLTIILSPLLMITSVQVLQDLSGITDVVFTSANGVAASETLALPHGLTAWCVGEKTGALARDAGFDPIIGPGDADGLVQLIIDRSPKGPLAHIRGTHSRGDINVRLNQAGMACIDVVAYDQTAQSLNGQAQNALRGKDPVVFPLFSPRTATILTKEVSYTAKVHFVAMSEAVRDAISRDNVTTTVAAQPDEFAMVAATILALRRLTQRSS